MTGTSSAKPSTRLWSLWVFDWRKVLVYTHRWLGIAGCVLFVAWFISGVVMMYARMPELANEERLARAAILDLSTITVSPADAADQLDIRADRLQVGMQGHRPVYRFSVGRGQTIVFADTGTAFKGVEPRRGTAGGAPLRAPSRGPHSDTSDM